MSEEEDIIVVQRISMMSSSLPAIFCLYERIGFDLQELTLMVSTAILSRYVSF